MTILWLVASSTMMTLALYAAFVIWRGKTLGRWWVPAAVITIIVQIVSAVLQ